MTPASGEDGVDDAEWPEALPPALQHPVAAGEAGFRSEDDWKLDRKPAVARIRTFLVHRRRTRALRKKKSGRLTSLLLLLFLLLLLGGFAWGVDYVQPDSKGRRISIDELSALAKADRLESAVFHDQDHRLEGRFLAQPVEKKRATKGKGKKDRPSSPKGSTGASPERGRKAKPKLGVDRALASFPVEGGEYWLDYPSSDAAFVVLSDIVRRSDARIMVESQGDKAVVRVVYQYLLPLLILATFFGLLFTSGRRSGGAGIGDLTNFASIGSKRQRRGHVTRVTFADVGGAHDAVEELREVVDYLKNPTRYETVGAIPPKGVLMVGPPGCGKTLLAKAVAGEAGVAFFSVAGAEFVESLVGIGAARVRDLFAKVRAVAPAIVFIDELDAAGRKRGAGDGGGGSDEREQTLNQILVEMDGFEASAGVVVIGATNRPDILDPALLRPGRFDRHVTIEKPNLEGRRQILALHARGKLLSPDVDLDYLAKRTPGFSGADLANVMNEAALLSIRQSKTLVETGDCEEAIQRVLHGARRKGRLLKPSEQERAALHEAGHAICAAVTGDAEGVHRVSILPRGKGLAALNILREEESFLFTRRELWGRVVTAMAGIAAEELVLEEPSTGAESDIEQATEMVRDIVGRYGFSPVLGRARLLASDVDQFLGGAVTFTTLGISTQDAIDREIKRLLARAEQEATKILTSNVSLLREMSGCLVEEETLEGDRLTALLSQVAQTEEDLGEPFTQPSTRTIAAS